MQEEQMVNQLASQTNGQADMQTNITTQIHILAIYWHEKQQQ